jgi:hypothetical protein
VILVFLFFQIFQSVAFDEVNVSRCTGVVPTLQNGMASSGTPQRRTDKRWQTGLPSTPARSDLNGSGLGV